MSMSSELLSNAEPSIYEVFEAFNSHLLLQKGYTKESSQYGADDPKAIKGFRNYRKGSLHIISFMSDEADDQSYISIEFDLSTALKSNKQKKLVMTCNFLDMDAPISNACFFQLDGIEFSHKNKKPSLNSFLDLFDEVSDFLCRYEERVALCTQTFLDIFSNCLSKKLYLSVDVREEDGYIIKTSSFAGKDKKVIRSLEEKYVHGTIQNIQRGNILDSILVSFQVQ